jgi:hypothetical protein
VSQTYGPAQLTPGVAVQFTVPKNAIAAHINNFSRYFVGVFFGDPLPGGFTATSLPAGQFHYIAEPGEKPTLEIVGNYTQDPALFTNGQNEFTGNIWLVPISVDTGLGLTGGSSANYATITSYLAGEVAPASTSSSRVVDSSSQERVVVIPLAVPRASGKWAPAAGDTLDIIDIALGPANFTNNVGKGVVNAYLYAIKGKVASPSGVANAFLEWTVEILLQDSTHTTLAGYAAQEVYHDVGSLTFSTAAGYAFQSDSADYPAKPVVGRQGFSNFTGLVPAAAYVRFQLHSLVQAGAPVLYFNALADCDLANTQTPGGIGEFGTATGIY